MFARRQQLVMLRLRADLPERWRNYCKILGNVAAGAQVIPAEGKSVVFWWSRKTPGNYFANIRFLEAQLFFLF